MTVLCWVGLSGLGILVAGLVGWRLGLEAGRRSRSPSWAEVSALKAYEAGVAAGRSQVLGVALATLARQGQMMRADGPETRGDTQ
jgi:hypothetical protein